MKSIVVLMSSYNGEKYIKEQIESILNQEINTGSLSLIIRDDGSTDHTLEIIDSISHTNHNITIIRGDHKGLVGSFFELIKLAQIENYDYYALSDQDDIWDKDKLRIAIEIMQGISSPFLYMGSSRVVDRNNKIKSNVEIVRKPITIYNTIIQNSSAGHTYVFNKSLAKLITNSTDECNVYMHDSFILNTAVVYGQIYYDQMSHVSYRQHEGNVLGEKNDLVGWFYLRLRRIIKGDSRKYARQIEYIYQKYRFDMDEESALEIKKFLDSRYSFVGRLIYIFQTKLYRQERKGDFFFRCLYLFGGYN